MGGPLHQGDENTMQEELMLKKQEALVAACDCLEMKCLESISLRSATHRGEIDIENYNSLINLVVARLTRQAINSRRHLDCLV